MVKINTYIKTNDRINSLENPNRNMGGILHCDSEVIYFENNSTYLERTITISCGSIYLTSDIWDFFDELWTYFLDSLNSLLKNKNKDQFYFFNQPCKVSIKRLYLQCGHGRKSDNKDEIQKRKEIEKSYFL